MSKELLASLGPWNAGDEHDTDPIDLERDGVPLDGVIHAVHASARAQSDALRSRSADLAREVLSRAENEVRDLLARGPLSAENANLPGDIVARAQREVREILAQGRNDAEVIELRAGQRAADLRAEADSLEDVYFKGDDSQPVTSLGVIHPEASEGRVSAKAILQGGLASPASDQVFATLHASPLPTEQGGLCYQLSGRLTLATMLAFQQAVSRLPGVNSARVEAEPADEAVLRMTTNDSSLVQALLGCMPGFHVLMDPA